MTKNASNKNSNAYTLTLTTGGGTGSSDVLPTMTILSLLNALRTAGFTATLVVNANTLTAWLGTRSLTTQKNKKPKLVVRKNIPKIIRTSGSSFNLSEHQLRELTFIISTGWDGRNMRDATELMEVYSSLTSILTELKSRFSKLDTPTEVNEDSLLQVGAHLFRTDWSVFNRWTDGLSSLKDPETLQYYDSVTFPQWLYRQHQAKDSWSVYTDFPGAEDFRSFMRETETVRETNF